MASYSLLLSSSRLTSSIPFSLKYSIGSRRQHPVVLKENNNINTSLLGFFGQQLVVLNKKSNLGFFSKGLPCCDGADSSSSPSPSPESVDDNVSSDQLHDTHILTWVLMAKDSLLRLMVVLILPRMIYLTFKALFGDAVGDLLVILNNMLLKWGINSTWGNKFWPKPPKPKVYESAKDDDEEEEAEVGESKDVSSDEEKV